MLHLVFERALIKPLIPSKVKDQDLSMRRAPSFSPVASVQPSWRARHRGSAHREQRAVSVWRPIRRRLRSASSSVHGASLLGLAATSASHLDPSEAVRCEAYTIYEVLDWRLRRSGSVVAIRKRAPNGAGPATRPRSPPWQQAWRVKVRGNFAAWRTLVLNVRFVPDDLRISCLVAP